MAKSIEKMKAGRITLLLFILLSSLSSIAQIEDYTVLETRAAWGASDTLNKCSLHVYFKDDSLKTSTNSLVSRGLFKKDRLHAYRIEAFYKTPNSYQKVSSINCVSHFIQGGFRESHPMAKDGFDSLILSARDRLNPFQNYIFIEVKSITTASSRVIMSPILENEKYTTYSMLDSDLYYKFFDTFSDMDLYLKRNKKGYAFPFPPGPILVFKLK